MNINMNTQTNTSYGSDSIHLYSLLSNIKHYHFIGIGGSGMAPLAEYQKLNSFTVTGSDIKESKNTEYLKSLSIPIRIKDFDLSFIKNIKEPTAFIISSAINKNQEELTAAKNNPNIFILHRSDLLAWISNQKRLISVAGTHGKTTTSAMISYVLDRMNQSPSSIIGGKLVGLNSLCMKGSSSLMVAEVDESDGSILKYRPTIAVLNNIAPDHLDFYKTLENERKTFIQYLNSTKKDGAIVVGETLNLDKNSIINTKLKNSILSFGFSDFNDIRITDYSSYHGVSKYQLNIKGETIHSSIKMFGKHNILNIASTIAVSKILGLNIKDVCECLESYPGVYRRMNLIHETTIKNHNIKIYDDYAHNPGKMFAAIEGLKESFPEYSINVLYQPHRFSRLETMMEESLSSFKKADTVYVFPVYSAGEVEKEPQKFSPERIAEQIKKLSKVNAIPIMQNESILDKINIDGFRNDQLFISLGAGDINKEANLLKKKLS